jgi:hypothetical protein
MVSMYYMALALKEAAAILNDPQNLKRLANHIVSNILPQNILLRRQQIH